MQGGTRVFYLHRHDLKVSVGGMEFALPGLRSVIVPCVRGNMVKSKGSVLEENIKAVVLQRMPQSAVCVTCVCVPIDGVILGVSHVLSSREMCVAPRVWVGSCCQTLQQPWRELNQLCWIHQPFPEVIGAAAWWGCQFWGFLWDFLPILKSQPGKEHALGNSVCSVCSSLLCGFARGGQSIECLLGSLCPTAGRSCMSMHDRVVLDNSALFFKYMDFQGGSR